MDFKEAAKEVGHLRENVSKSIFGQDDVITETLCCFIASGHILMTGAPGLAKTTLVRVFARHLGLDFGRVQFTPDLLPSDIIGSQLLNLNPETGKRAFEFSKGPVFTNLLLADEINRASPRTQSALLEAMQERTVTVASDHNILPNPFMVFATQNPFESEGTFPLPEAQLDRFLIHTLVGYPSADAEQTILNVHAEDNLFGEKTRDQLVAELAPMSREIVTSIIAQAKAIKIDPVIIGAIKDLVRSSRPEDENCPESMKPLIWYGAGPRAGISLISVCRALALMEHSEGVRWQHVKRMAKPVLRHRIRLSARGNREGKDEDFFIDELLQRLEAKTKNLARGIDP